MDSSGQGGRPTDHVLIVRGPSLDQVSVVISAVRFVRGRKIHLPDCGFLAAIIASNFHGRFAANEKAHLPAYVMRGRRPLYRDRRKQAGTTRNPPRSVQRRIHDHDAEGPGRRLGGQHSRAANASRTAAIFRDGATQPAIEKLPERSRHARFTQKILSRNKLERESNSNYSARSPCPHDKRRP